MSFTLKIAALVVAFSQSASAYKLVHNYDYTNWYTSMNFNDLPDPTNGFVDYVSLKDAQSSGLTKIINKQVYMGVDNTTTITNTNGAGRKSIWTTSKDEFTHGLLIGDFAHMPGSSCGTWPAFWTITNSGSHEGEFDILEGYNDGTYNYMSLHTNQQPCTFQSPANLQQGTPNEENYDCNLENGAGCSVQAPEASYGDPFNANGGGVYAMQWTSSFIKIFFFPRNKIPADIKSGNPDPTKWGLPAGNFDSKYGNCNIDKAFEAQTIYFDTTFCGEGAGGQAWTDWSDCSAVTGYSTCEQYVASNPQAFKNAYWLVNSVKVYQ